MEADVYGESPEMSTYLVAFVVSQFKSTSATTSRGLKVFIFTVLLYNAVVLANYELLRATVTVHQFFCILHSTE